MSTPDMNRRFAWATYASFSNARTGGGWQIGHRIGLNEIEAAKVEAFAPTTLETTTPITNFLTSQEIDNLPRRFQYLANVPKPGQSMYLQSVPAGSDATGRPGNIFTIAVIDRDARAPLDRSSSPATRYNSPDFPTPFLAPEVNNVHLDTSQLAPAPNHAMGSEVAWIWVFGLQGRKDGALYRLQDALSDPRTLPVIVTPNPAQMAIFIMALHTTMRPDLSRTAMSFCTYERAHNLDIDLWLSRGPAVVGVPEEDSGSSVLRDPRITVIDLTAEDNYEPMTLWSEVTKEFFAPSTDEGSSPTKAIAMQRQMAALQPNSDVNDGGGQPDFGDELCEAIHEIAQTLPDEQRRDWLERLDRVDAKWKSSDSHEGRELISDVAPTGAGAVLGTHDFENAPESVDEVSYYDAEVWQRWNEIFQPGKHPDAVQSSARIIQAIQLIRDGHVADIEAMIDQLSMRNENFLVGDFPAEDIAKVFIPIALFNRADHPLFDMEPERWAYVSARIVELATVALEQWQTDLEIRQKTIDEHNAWDVLTKKVYDSGIRHAAADDFFILEILKTWDHITRHEKDRGRSRNWGKWDSLSFHLFNMHRKAIRQRLDKEQITRGYDK